MRRAAWIAAAVALAACVPAAYREPLPAEATHFRAKTADGWELDLVRYLPPGPRTQRPILFLHGISSNGRFMDLDARHSIARWFHAQGREAWVLSLRGLGLSDRPDEAKGRRAGITVDDYALRDLPAAIATIREVSGASAIDFVGHSMGGVVAYAYLSQGGDGIAAGVIMGSPTRLDWGLPYAGALVTAAGLFDGRLIFPNTNTAGGVFAGPVSAAMPGTPLEHMLYNPANTRVETMHHLMVVGVDDVSSGVAKQFARMIEDGFFGSADGKLDYREGMKDIRIPMLVVAGRADRLGVPPAVRDGYRHLGGPKEWLMMSEANGAAADYSHLDFVLGERAPTELWPRLKAFLDAHAG